MGFFLPLAAVELSVGGSARRCAVRVRGNPDSMPRGHIGKAFKVPRTFPPRAEVASSSGRTASCRRRPRVRPAVAAARCPQNRSSPPGAGSSEGFSTALLVRVSARSQSRNARASGLSAEPEAIARK